LFPHGGGILQNRIGAVTRACSGIGAAVVRALNVEGARCAPPEAWCLLTSRIRGKFEILINSAGVMYYTLMKNVRMEEWERTREEPLKTVRLANHGNRHLGAAICLVCNTAKGR
jgi:NADP-dependent 3-hydroxy acid dehydrogenase YdfG